MTYDFLSAFYYAVPILHRFWNTAVLWSKIANFAYTPPLFGIYPCCGLPHLIIIKTSWVRKLATHAATHDNMFSDFHRILVTDERTQGHGTYYASISSRSKNRDSDLCKCSHFCSVSCRSDTCVRRRGSVTNSFHFRLSFNRTLLLPNSVTPSTLLRIVNPPLPSSVSFFLPRLCIHSLCAPEPLQSLYTNPYIFVFVFLRMFSSLISPTAYMQFVPFQLI